MHRLAPSLLLMAAASTIADDSSVIEWDASRPLSWADFVGSVPRSADDERVAATTASISWSYNYTVARSDSGCAFTITEIDSTASFHPESSWVRPAHRTSAVLEHEQGHFDIAHLYREAFKTRTRPLIDFRGACKGNSNRKAARHSEREIAALIGQVYDEVWAEYRRRQQAYDRETQHGSDVAAQARWTAEIESMLDPAESH